MPEPIKWRSKILLAKIEAVYGTNSNPGAVNGILAKNVSFSPMEGEDVSRELDYPWLGGQAEIPAGLRAVLTFETELVGSGAAGTAPKWGVLARASALAEIVTPATDVVYSPVSEGHESCSILFWVGSTRHIMLGTRGTGIAMVNAQGIPVIRWTMTGRFAPPAEAARVNPDLSGFQAPQLATDANTPTFTIAGVELVLRAFTFNLGNKVEPRLLIGREEMRISDRAEELTAAVEAVPLTAFDPFAVAQAQTRVPAIIEHGTIAGRRVRIAAPTCQLKRLSSYDDQDGELEWPLRLAPLPTTGNDQFSITLT